MKEITIDLIRHGDVAGGTKLLGKTDELLSTLGWQQMQTAIENKPQSWNKIISSPLLRCSAFAEQLADKLSLPFEVNEQFKEMDFGRWDGQLFADLYSGNDNEQLMQLMQDPNSVIPPDGEAYANFELRVITAWNALLISLHQNEIEHCLLVAHGGVIRMIMSHVLGFPSTNLFRVEVPYACMSRFKQYENYPPRLVFHSG
jgi:alpha-ribazole phosphatase